MYKCKFCAVQMDDYRAVQRHEVDEHPALAIQDESLNDIMVMDGTIPFHQSLRISNIYRHYTDNINHEHTHLQRLLGVIRGHPQFAAMAEMLMRGYEAKRAEMERRCFEEMWSCYYRLIAGPQHEREAAESIAARRAELEGQTE